MTQILPRLSLAALLSLAVPLASSNALPTASAVDLPIPVAKLEALRTGRLSQRDHAAAASQLRRLPS